MSEDSSGNGKSNDLVVQVLQNIYSEIQGLRREMKEEIGGLRKEMKEEIGGLRKEMKEELGAVKEELGTVKEEIRTVKEEIRTVKEEIRTVNERLDDILHFMGGHYREHEQRIKSLEKWRERVDSPR